MGAELGRHVVYVANIDKNEFILSTGSINLQYGNLLKKTQDLVTREKIKELTLWENDDNILVIAYIPGTTNQISYFMNENMNTNYSVRIISVEVPAECYLDKLEITGFELSDNAEIKTTFMFDTMNLGFRKELCSEENKTDE